MLRRRSEWSFKFYFYTRRVRETGKLRSVEELEKRVREEKE